LKLLLLLFDVVVILFKMSSNAPTEATITVNLGTTGGSSSDTGATVRQTLLDMKSTFKQFISDIEDKADQFKPSYILSAIIQIAEEAHAKVESIPVIQFVKEIVTGEDNLIEELQSKKIGAKHTHSVYEMDLFSNDEHLQNYIDAHNNRAKRVTCYCF
jgi:hypothetical protein